MYENDIYSNSDNGSYNTYQTDGTSSQRTDFVMAPDSNKGRKKKKGASASFCSA